jgi:cytochrome c553
LRSLTPLAPSTQPPFRRVMLLGLALGLCAALVIAPSPARAQLPQPPDTMEARTQACVPCHGPQGSGTANDYFPRLSGKPAGYLYNQLLAFREGRRRYPPMNYLLQYLSEPYLQRMAEYYAAQRPPGQAMTIPTAPPEMMGRGRAIVGEGAPERGVPACSLCHGPGLVGMEPGIPGLLGLKPTYITAQLGGWRYGTRTAIAPDCMQHVASLLNESDVAAVASYLGSLPVPADPSPLPRGALITPLACGSQPQ